MKKENYSNHESANIKTHNESIQKEHLYQGADLSKSIVKQFKKYIMYIRGSVNKNNLLGHLDL